MRMLSAWRYFLRDTVRNLTRNGWMTAASVLTVAAALFVLAFFMVVSINLNHVTQLLESEVEMQVFIKPGTPRSVELATLATTRHWPGVRRVEFFTKQQAARNLEREFPQQQELGALLSQSNRLFDGYDVYAQSPAAIPALARRYQALPVVQTVVYQGQVVARLSKIAALVQAAGWGLEILLGLGALFIISNTIRLAVYARRREVAIMKLVGATDWFIRWPFVLEGLALGAVGGLVTDAVVFFGYRWAYAAAARAIPFWPLAPVTTVQQQVFGPVLASAVGVGILGSLLSIRRFLRT